jgi:hypothetical protein
MLRAAPFLHETRRGLWPFRFFEMRLVNTGQL